MNRRNDGFILMRTGDREHIREARTDDVGFITHATCDNHTAVFRNRLTNSLKALFLCGVQKATGVDQHNVGARIIGRQAIAIGAQLCEDPFAIDQRLGTAK